MAYAGQSKKFRCEVHIFAKISEFFFHLLVSECLGINSSNSDLFANNLQEMDLRDLNFTSILLAHLKRITQLKKNFKKPFLGTFLVGRKEMGHYKQFDLLIHVLPEMLIELRGNISLSGEGV